MSLYRNIRQYTHTQHKQVWFPYKSYGIRPIPDIQHQLVESTKVHSRDESF